METYSKPECRLIDLRLETTLLTGSTETIPIDPFDPGF
jgi:hypothetical protein